MGQGRHGLGRRAIERLSPAPDVDIAVLDEPIGGDRADTVVAAGTLAKLDAGAVVVFGGDGTHRDVVCGWPEAPIVPVSTGTNNVFPMAWDAAAAGTAAALVSTGAVSTDRVARRAKRITVHISGSGVDVDDVALVDMALVDGAFVGARAVWRADGITAVVAAIATPLGSGLSSIAGRVHPVERWAPWGAVVELGPGGRTVRLPLLPGSFETISVARSRRLALDEPVVWPGPGVLALDGERTHVLRADDRAVVTVRDDGPWVIDVEQALYVAVDARHFDLREDLDTD